MDPMNPLHSTNTPRPTDAAHAHLPDEAHQDGNALAGPFSEIFAVDMTSAIGRCTGCGSTGPLARLHVYGPGPGLVARCPDCEQVVLRLVRGPDEAWLDLRGTVSLRIPLSRP
jgi:hypothetical protein